MAYDTPPDTTSEQTGLEYLNSRWKNLSGQQLMAEAVTVATRQLLASTDFKRPRMTRLAKYWALYDGQTPKKLRQLFNVNIPVFAGMIDTLNSEHDTPVQMKFKEGDAADYFKVQKINGAFQMEVMDTAQNSKWDSKLRMARKHAIMNGLAIPKLTSRSDPEYKSELEIINLKNFHFQPRGGLYLENHLFAGEEDIEKTRSELISGAMSGAYDKNNVRELLRLSADSDYFPDRNSDFGQKLSRFKPLGLNPDGSGYVGETVFKLVSWILNIDGKRFYLCFDPWTKQGVRLEKWEDICSSELFPWVPYATHEDDENLLSKAYSDDLYPAADAIVAMFNQELTGRERRNIPSIGYDKEMVVDPRKLDEALTIPGRMVPLDTKGGSRRISEAFYEFKTGELNGTVNLIDWITGSLGRNTGATDLAMGDTQEVSKKASVTFAEQKSVSKRLSWASQPFQEMMAGLGKRYIYGLKDNMPSTMAIRLMGERGWDWDQITRMDLSTTKDIDVLIQSTDQQRQESEMNTQKRKDALVAIGADPILSPVINPKWRASELLAAVGGYEDADIAEATDTKSNADKKSLAKAAEAIQLILQGQTPVIWYGATPAFMQKIVDFASDNRSTLKEKFDTLIAYASAHLDIAKQNIERKAAEDARTMMLQQGAVAPGASAPTPKTEPTGIPGGVSRAMNIAAAA